MFHIYQYASVSGRSISQRFAPKERCHRRVCCRKLKQSLPHLAASSRCCRSRPGSCPRRCWCPHIGPRSPSTYPGKAAPAPLATAPHCQRRRGPALLEETSSQLLAHDLQHDARHGLHTTCTTGWIAEISMRSNRDLMACCTRN